MRSAGALMSMLTVIGSAMVTPPVRTSCRQPLPEEAPPRPDEVPEVRLDLAGQPASDDGHGNPDVGGHDVGAAAAICRDDVLTVHVDRCPSGLQDPPAGDLAGAVTHHRPRVHLLHPAIADKPPE